MPIESYPEQINYRVLSGMGGEHDITIMLLLPLSICLNRQDHSHCSTIIVKIECLQTIHCCYYIQIYTGMYNEGIQYFQFK